MDLFAEVAPLTSIMRHTLSTMTRYVYRSSSDNELVQQSYMLYKKHNEEKSSIEFVFSFSLSLFCVNTKASAVHFVLRQFF